MYPVLPADLPPILPSECLRYGERAQVCWVGSFRRVSLAFNVDLALLAGNVDDHVTSVENSLFRRWLSLNELCDDGRALHEKKSTLLKQASGAGDWIRSKHDISTRFVCQFKCATLRGLVELGRFAPGLVPRKAFKGSFVRVEWRCREINLPAQSGPEQIWVLLNGLRRSQPALDCCTSFGCFRGVSETQVCTCRNTSIAAL